MQFILDHLIAMIVMGVIILMMFTLRLRMQETTVDAFNHYSLTKQELGFVDMMKRDLHGATRVDYVTETVVGSDTLFVFYGQLDMTSPSETKITYKRTKVDERELDDGTIVPLYQIQRFQGTNPSGASMLTVTQWHVQGRNREGGSIADPQDAEQIYVRFEAAAPFKESSVVTRTRWEATFHPPMMQKDLLF